ncbi:hypothetical protein fugu_011486 [Takifugu bimaculatus]|uniref:Small monomeric GTPase n=1 Tax=Takifugu bimaculatus TaxID=433685 RepID=A0A4Z2C7S4_9TELE|nr:hypothetical protein fugu_011486 [Takifugu bimaculatus]
MKTLTVGSATVTLQLWDTAGQERFCSITEQYYRKADGILAMYDLTQSASFAAVRGWMHSVKEKACDGAVLVLLANKLDRADRRQVAASEGQGLAKQHQALFYECSARNGCNIEEVMTELARAAGAACCAKRGETLLWWEARDQASAQDCVKVNLERRPRTDTGVGVTRGRRFAKLTTSFWAQT